MPSPPAAPSAQQASAQFLEQLVSQLEGGGECLNAAMMLRDLCRHITLDGPQEGLLIVARNVAQLSGRLAAICRRLPATARAQKVKAEILQLCAVCWLAFQALSQGRLPDEGAYRCACLTATALEQGCQLMDLALEGHTAYPGSVACVEELTGDLLAALTCLTDTLRQWYCGQPRLEAALRDGPLRRPATLVLALVAVCRGMLWMCDTGRQDVLAQYDLWHALLLYLNQLGSFDWLTPERQLLAASPGLQQRIAEVVCGYFGAVLLRPPHNFQQQEDWVSRVALACQPACSQFLEHGMAAVLQQPGNRVVDAAVAMVRSAPLQCPAGVPEMDHLAALAACGEAVLALGQASIQGSLDSLQLGRLTELLDSIFKAVRPCAAAYIHVLTAKLRLQQQDFDGYNRQVQAFEQGDYRSKYMDPGEGKLAPAAGFVMALAHRAAATWQQAELHMPASAWERSCQMVAAAEAVLRLGLCLRTHARAAPGLSQDTREHLQDSLQVALHVAAALTAAARLDEGACLPQSAQEALHRQGAHFAATVAKVLHLAYNDVGPAGEGDAWLTLLCQMPATFESHEQPVPDFFVEVPSMWGNWWCWSFADALTTVTDLLGGSAGGGNQGTACGALSSIIALSTTHYTQFHWCLDGNAGSPGAQLHRGHAMALLTSCANLACPNLAGVGEDDSQGRRCAGCRRVRYCSMHCLEADRRKHKAFCEAAERGQQPAGPD